MSDINKLPKTQITKVDNSSQISYPNISITENSKDTAKKYGNLDLNQLLGTITSVSETVQGFQNQGQGQDGVQYQPYPTTGGTGRQWNDDIPNADQQTRILGMKPLVFTLTALGIAGLLGLLLWAFTKGKGKKAAAA